MLDKQVHIYSVDTSYFYSNKEQRLETLSHKLMGEIKVISYKISELFKNNNLSESTFKKIYNSETQNINPELMQDYDKYQSLISYKKKKMAMIKEQLLLLLQNKVNHNCNTNGKDHIRKIKTDSIPDNHIISIFDSTLTREIGMNPNAVSDDLIVVQVYFFDVFKDILLHGFTFHSEKYIFLTASSGQIRQKKAVFIKESTWIRIKDTIMCGLTLEDINIKGGCNVNKFLVYMALPNSATDEWNDFDIDRCIVIDDFETDVYGEFDYIDETDYSITRKYDKVPITHTDGAGMMLPSVMTKNTMIRLPWIKGLLGVFDFIEFIKVNQGSYDVVDIYGDTHNLINENIQIIFTKSQFKMWRYYKNWNDYKEKYKKFHCHAGLCNTERDRIGNAKINYQMLQTLTDITEDEIKYLVQKSQNKILNLCNSRDTMLNVLGANPYNYFPTPFQQALRIYPELLNDIYTKDILREKKNSLIKKYRSGRIEIDGKYTFILPDFYAACEYWFCGIKTPIGLLQNKEVFCKLYNQYEKLDCLRSPHLYREHAIRKNLAYKDTIAYKWFTTNGIYTSCHDLISKILQFDVDGDMSLVVADKYFIHIAEKNMSGIVPLYYNMRKAEPNQLTLTTIYTGLITAFTGGNIGLYSNNISKIWNDEVFISGTEQEKEHALNCIKCLCCQNNYVIDYAKTLYKPEFPEKIKADIKQFTKHKPPAFFEFAKNKNKYQIEPRNKSIVNSLYHYIPNRHINTRNINLGTFDYTKLTKNRNVNIDDSVVQTYKIFNQRYRHMLLNSTNTNQNNFELVKNKIKSQFASLNLCEDDIVDMLIKYLYQGDKRQKSLLWLCWGEKIVENLKHNLPERKIKTLQCVDCGEWFDVFEKNNRQCRCASCQKERRKEQYKSSKIKKLSR